MIKHFLTKNLVFGTKADDIDPEADVINKFKHIMVLLYSNNTIRLIKTVICLLLTNQSSLFQYIVSMQF